MSRKAGRRCSRRHRPPDGSQREVWSGADGLVGDRAMGRNLAWRDSAIKRQEPDKPLQRLHLSWRWASLGEITDKADSDAMLVEIIVGSLAMGAVLLRMPSRAHFHRTVAAAGAVADHEMVSKPLPTLVAMGFVKTLRTASGCRAVVNDDRRPPWTDLAGGRKPPRISRRTPN